MGLFRNMAACLALVVLTALPAAARQDGAEAPRKKVGLVLSGGGAKGVAHVGVLKVLEEIGIPVDYIAGTSMGSIVGGLYSIGYTPSQLDSLFRNQNWLDLLADKVEREDKLYSQKVSGDKYMVSIGLGGEEGTRVPLGVLAGQNVYTMLTELTLGYHEMESFDDLPIPFACVSYDVAKGQEYVARSGSLPASIRASMSIPGAFTPQRIDSMILVDGGVMNNYPVDVVREMGAEVVIGVDVGGSTPTYEELDTPMGMVEQILTIFSDDRFQANKAASDVYMAPDITPYTSASFSTDAIATLLNRGEAVAREHYDELVALRESLGEIEPVLPQTAIQKPLRPQSFYVGDIVFRGVTGYDSDRMLRYIEIEPHSIITKGDLERMVALLRGSGVFSTVSYSLNTESPYDLVITVRERERTSVDVGARFDTEVLASLLVNASVSSVKGNIYSPKIGATARLSESPYVIGYLNSGRIGFASMELSAFFRHNDFAVYRDGHRNNTATFNTSGASLAFTDIYLRNFNASLRADFEYYDYETFLYKGDAFSTDVRAKGFLNYSADIHYETLDDAYFPTRGSSLYAKYTLYTDNGARMDGGSPVSALQYSLFTVRPLAEDIVLIPALYGRTMSGSHDAYSYLNYVGGYYDGRYMSQQLPFTGIRNVEIYDNSVMIGALSLSARMARNHYITLKGNYLVSAQDFFDMFSLDNTLFGYGLEYSFRTPVGPLILQIAGRGKRFGGVYAGFGKFF